MKTALFCAAALASAVAVSSCSCQNNNNKNQQSESNCPEYTVVEKAQVNLADYPVDADGYYVIFDGPSLNGW